MLITNAEVPVREALQGTDYTDEEIAAWVKYAEDCASSAESEGTVAVADAFYGALKLAQSQRTPPETLPERSPRRAQEKLPEPVVTKRSKSK